MNDAPEVLVFTLPLPDRPRRGPKPGAFHHTMEWRLELSRRLNTWTDADIVAIRDWYVDRKGKKLELGVLAGLLRRTKPYLCRKARSLGLTDKKRTSGRKKTSKWGSVEESRAAIGRSVREWIALHGHPRGMLGKKHSPETIEALTRRVRSQVEAGTHPWQRPRTEAQLQAAAEAMRKRLTSGANVYSSARRGYREDLGDNFFRSRWEANYARYLKLLAVQKVITDWTFEEDTFWFEGVKRGVRSYTPDFKVWRPDTSFYYVEVKGWMDTKSATKIKRMAKYHPKVELQVLDAKAYNEIERKLGGAIPHWEFAKSKTPTYTRDQMLEMGLIRPPKAA